MVTAEAIYELGVPIADPDAEPLAYGECARIARRLRAPGYAPIGLAPAGPDVAVPPVGIQIASVFVDLTGASAAYVDAFGRIPTRAWSTPDGSRGPCNTLPTSRWLRDGLAIVTPAAAWSPRHRALAGKRAVREVERGFRHIVVDLSGFDELGERDEIVDSLRSVVIVAAARRTTEDALLAAVEGVPPAKRAGAVLVG